MNSERRNLANRANALHSTGPKTAEGKRRSSLNAVRHGLTGQAVVLAGEDAAAYARLCKRYFDDLQPKAVVEEELVQTLADIAWRRNRLRVIENNLYALGRAENARDRIVHDSKIRAGLVMAEVFTHHARNFATLSMHEQRLSRQYGQALKQLNEAQAVRRAREERDIEHAAMLRKLNNMRDIPFDPAEDGFVLSTAEIDTHIRRAQRRQEAYAASLYDFDPLGAGA